MQKILTAFIISSMLSPCMGFSQNRSIRFTEKTWAEIQSMARKENKLIFLDAFASWCGPCKWMAANVFTNDTVADYFNKTFICAKIDMEKGEGITLARQFEVRAYPTLLFIDTAGNMVHKKVGASRKIRDYIDLGLKVQNPGECYAATLKRYNSGELDPAFIITHLINLKDAYLPITEPLKRYFETQKDGDLINQINWNIIYGFSEDMNSREFLYLVTHEKDFGLRYTGDSVLGKINQVYSWELNKLFRIKPFPQTSWDSLLDKIRKSGFSGANAVILDAQLNLYSSQADTTKFVELAIREVDRVYRDDYNKLNNVAWQVYSMSDDRKNLEMAAVWALRSIELKEESFNCDTYSAILYKLGRKGEAIRMEKKAIELAKKANVSTKNYEETLTRMQSGK